MGFQNTDLLKAPEQLIVAPDMLVDLWFFPAVMYICRSLDYKKRLNAEQEADGFELLEKT